ncbi:hypothetical protein BWI96_08930 [Siphonobacter sp. SORGH_AS_0500]|uniref:sce7726 family protein n=1 Tax=Siphonobacter sp. SORGH_AS_0500 TaxID=1864824 RepID=UPI000CB7A7E4|nr:sce7726 family protein [Siphonobacter sp. SORGH_AS_0500]PKK36994.1 hypothetical protein BWI96_08930 [Siphonobacter sp. SORGH_AS_0500]
MKANNNISSANLNALAKLISNASFKRLISNENANTYGKQIKKLLSANGKSINKKFTINELINISYNHLLENYRYEYIYKSIWLNEYVLKEYCLSNTIILNEFKIGNSIADAVLVNGINKVFEIKTELDSPERLTSQINDYYRAFSEVYIIIHHSLLHKYICLIEQSVGIMLLSPENLITEYRPSTPVTSKLDSITMIKALRKDEFLTMVKNILGYIPTAKPVHLFRACVEILLQYPENEIQKEFLKIIKNRINPSTNHLITTSKIPNTLKLSCYLSNITPYDYDQLLKKLQLKF